MESSDLDIRSLMTEAYLAAAGQSHDQKTQNGAVLIGLGGESVGANNFPYVLHEYPDDDMKAKLIIHAEERAIFNAASDGLVTRGGILICPWAPCTRCARAIIGANLAELVTHKSMMDRTYSKYKLDVADALLMLERAGVKWTNWEGEIGQGVTNLMNGLVWNP